MPEAAVNGVRLHYDVAGDGPPLVFVHGMCGRGAVWSGQVERLSDAFTCVTYDRRGHGASSDGGDPHTVPLHGDDLAALVRHLELPPVVLVGSSGGARICLDVLLRHPGLLAGAVLSEPPVFSLDPEHGREFMGRVVPAVQPRLDAGDLRGAVDGFFGVVCPGLWRQLDEDGQEPYRASGQMLVADLQQPPLAVTTDDLSVGPAARPGHRRDGQRPVPTGDAEGHRGHGALGPAARAARVRPRDVRRAAGRLRRGGARLRAQRLRRRPGGLMPPTAIVSQSVGWWCRAGEHRAGDVAAYISTTVAGKGRTTSAAFCNASICRFARWLGRDALVVR